jgi:hypothetical protein
MMATATVQTDSAGPFTRALFMTRPYLPGQKYTTDPGNAYLDHGDDGPLMSHLAKELGKVVGIEIPLIADIPLSRQVEAHPKIKQFPFKGAHLLRVKVRPPEVPPAKSTVPHKLVVSFHFTVRTGCSVQVVSLEPGTADITIVMNSSSYSPPPLPHRIDRTYSRSEFDSMSPGVGSKILSGEAIVTGSTALFGDVLGSAKTAAILSRGIKTSEYVIRDNVNVLDRTNAVLNAPPAQTHAGEGITVNDDQIYPVHGWLEARWQFPSTNA